MDEYQAEELLLDLWDLQIIRSGERPPGLAPWLSEEEHVSNIMQSHTEEIVDGVFVRTPINKYGLLVD